MILPILLVFLAGTVSLAAALAAFIISRAYGRSAFSALCYAAATFTAALTLIFLALTFVENADQDHYMRADGWSTMGPAASMIGNSESAGRPMGLRETHVSLTGYVPLQINSPDQHDSQALREGGPGMAEGQQPGGGDPRRTAWAEEQITQLFRDHYRRIDRLVQRSGFSEADSADILNISGAAVYYRLVEKGPVRGKLVSYFTKAVKNQMAQWKRNELREPVELVGDEILAALPADPTPASPGAAASCSPEQAAQLKAALAALDELPGYLREPYDLEVYERLSPEEIARRLGKSPGTIRPYLSVADAAVKKRVAELLQPGVGGREDDDE